MAQRKISFNYLFLKDGEEEVLVQEPLTRLLNYLNEKQNIERKQDINKEKIAFLDSCNFEDPYIKIVFKSAKHSYRAPLLDKNTVVARENPKTMDEGEQVKTHLLIKMKEEDAILFLETGNNAMTCGNIIAYLNKAILQFNSEYNTVEEKIRGKFCFDMIPRDDFREVLESMERVLCAEVYVDKDIIGSDYLNFSQRTEEIKENVVLMIKAEKKKNIRNSVYEFVNKLNGDDSIIRRIRVRGKLDTGNESIIDTAFIIKKEYIDVQQNNDTGEYNTTDMFVQLIDLANNY